MNGSPKVSHPTLITLLAGVKSNEKYVLTKQLMRVLFYSIIYRYLLIAYTFSTICCINIRSTTITTIIRTSFIICFIIAISITNIIWMLKHAACKPKKYIMCYAFEIKAEYVYHILVLKVRKSRAKLNRYFISFILNKVHYFLYF